MEPYVITAGTSRRIAINPDCQEDLYNHYLTYQLVVHFRGNRARLTNLDLVARNLQTSPDDIATFLAKSLNAAVKRSPGPLKQGQGGGDGAASWVLYPASLGTVEEMNRCFRAFLTSLLCPSCCLPELSKDRRGGTKRCRACGWDQRDTKFVGYVLAHPAREARPTE